MCLHVQTAALKMAYSEYGDLTVEERLAILSALTHLALSSEVVREHFAAAVEAAATAPPRPSSKKVCCRALLPCSADTHTYSEGRTKMPDSLNQQSVRLRSC